MVLLFEGCDPLSSMGTCTDCNISFANMLFVLYIKQQYSSQLQSSLALVLIISIKLKEKGKAKNKKNSVQKQSVSRGVSIV